MNVEWLTVSVPVTGELVAHHSKEGGSVDDVLAITLAAVVFNIWTAFIKCPSSEQTAKAFLSAVLP